MVYFCPQVCLVEFGKYAFFFAAGTSNILAYICIVCLPVFLIWLVFSYVNQYLQNKTVNQQLYKLFGQMKKKIRTIPTFWPGS
ncbi:MAG: hypothetical protein ACLSBF_02280 [Alphaproteobacteria bacterium]